MRCDWARLFARTLDPCYFTEKQRKHTTVLLTENRRMTAAILCDAKPRGNTSVMRNAHICCQLCCNFGAWIAWQSIHVGTCSLRAHSFNSTFQTAKTPRHRARPRDCVVQAWSCRLACQHSCRRLQLS